MKGFIALLSVIIISVILLGLALSGSNIAFFLRMNGIDQESYVEAQSLMRSCADYALLQLAQNYSYAASHQLVQFGSDTCYIESISTLAASTTQKEVQIQTAANFHNAFASLTVTTWVYDPGVAH